MLAFHVFGVNKPVYCNTITINKKHDHPWLTSDSKTARHELNRANRCLRTNENYLVVIDKRRYYRKVKRKAKILYESKQKVE
jgi:hypothetical protein